MIQDQDATKNVNSNKKKDFMHFKLKAHNTAARRFHQTPSQHGN
jgi:hypothetical protein